MFTFDSPKPTKRRSPAQDNAWYANTPAASTTKAGRSEQGWYSSSQDLANGLEIVEADEDTVRRMFADTSLG
jgi:hypothetical protein